MSCFRITIGLLVVLAADAALADEVVLKHDIRVFGTIVRDDLDGVVMISEKNVKLRYRPAEVAEIRRTCPADFMAARKLLRSKEFGAAALAFEQIALKRPSVVLQEEAWLRVAQSYAVLGERERAIHAYAAMMRVNPRTKFYGHMPLIAQHFDAFDRTLQFLGGFIDRAPTDFVRALGQLIASSVLMTAGQYGESERGLRVLLGDKDPRVVAFAHVRWAQLLVLQNRWTDALAGLRKWIESMDAGAQPQAYYWLGECYWKKADYARAAAAFLRAPLEFPEFWELHPACTWRAARCFRKLGQLDRSRKLLRGIVAQFPRSPQAREAAEDLETLLPPIK